MKLEGRLDLELGWQDVAAARTAKSADLVRVRATLSLVQCVYVKIALQFIRQRFNFTESFCLKKTFYVENIVLGAALDPHGRTQPARERRCSALRSRPCRPHSEANGFRK